MATKARIGAIELGGTKCIAIVACGENIINEKRFETRDPESTMAAALNALKKWNDDEAFDAIGVASFGPVSLNPNRPDYGNILKTPKPGWTGTPIVKALKELFDCPISIETDVTAAALAEYAWGAGQGTSSMVYITIGTGLGGGILIDGIPVRGRLHPEIGHLALRRFSSDHFTGICPFHGDCIEGLLSGPALKARFGMSADQMPPDDPAWNAPAHDLASLLASLIFAVAPEKILIGGGVGMGAPKLIEKAIGNLPELLANYLPNLGVRALQQMICNPALGDRAGPMGAIAVGMRALH